MKNSLIWIYVIFMEFFNILEYSKFDFTVRLSDGFEINR